MDNPSAPPIPNLPSAHEMNVEQFHEYAPLFIHHKSNDTLHRLWFSAHIHHVFSDNSSIIYQQIDTLVPYCKDTLKSAIKEFKGNPCIQTINQMWVMYNASLHGNYIAYIDEHMAFMSGKTRDYAQLVIEHVDGEPWEAEGVKYFYG